MGETLTALSLKPRVNLIGFYGVFAPNNRHRASATTEQSRKKHNQRMSRISE
jgi:hypothetical protein